MTGDQLSCNRKQAEEKKKTVLHNLTQLLLLSLNIDMID